MSRQSPALPASIDETLSLLGSASYVGDRALATVIFLSLRLGRPLFLEGEAGVGKTEVAKVLAASLDRKLIRLQCYEGLDVASAVYEWNYPAQMMAIRLAEASGEHDKDRIEHDIFSQRYLIKRPLLQALEPGVNGAPVLLIDEIDRADEAFEAYLLEILSDFQVTIPEIGVMAAPEPPIVVITSNRTREIHDALKRRCLYHWLGYPDLAREMAIVGAKAPRAPERLTAELVAFVQRLRKQDLFKSPGVAETLDWAAALTELDAVALDPAQVSDTLGVLLKYQDDIAKIEGAKAQTLIEETRAELRRLEIGSEREIEPSEMTAIVEAEPASGGVLAQNIVHFARALREAGVPLGPGAVVDALAAVEAAGVGNREDFYTTLHAVFVKKHEHSLLFDQAFRIFWKRKGFIEKLIAMLSPRAPSKPDAKPARSRGQSRRRRPFQNG